MTSRLAALALLCCLPGAAVAADLGARAPAPVAVAPSSDWIVTLSATGQVEPRFPGSDKFGFTGYPGIEVRRADTPAHFSAPDDGFSVTLYDNPWFRVGPVLRIQSGRYYEDDRRLVGLRKIDWTVEGGVFAEIWPVEFIRARIEVRHGFNDDSGFVGNVGVDYVVPYGAFRFSVGPRLAWGDDRYTRTYFGVTALEATLNPRVFAYRPDGGVTSVGALGAVTYNWSPTWSTTVYAGYNRLTGDAADSPIPRNIGSRDQIVAGATLSYSFAMAPWW
jgi:outer membrane protein